jgi:hypothetical protein
MALPLAWRWAAKRRLARAAPRDERNVGPKGGQFQAAVLPSAVEPSSWPERPQRSPSMVWL